MTLDNTSNAAHAGHAMDALPDWEVAALLCTVPIPEDGLVLTSIYADTTPHLTAGARFRLVADVETRLPATAALHHSTDNSGHSIGVWPYTGGYWVSRHVDDDEGIYECRVFPNPTAAYRFYADVVRGLQDATNGEAWEVTDVPGLLAGNDLHLAKQVGLSYWEAQDQYGDDPDGCRLFWEVVGPPPAL